MAKSAEDLPPGSRIAGFEVMSVLGRGSFGTVYLAKQGDLADRPVVLKVSPSLQAESRMLARLQHTNIVPIYSVHRSDTLQVVCMPFLGMTTLKDVLDDIRNHVSLPETGYGLISSLLDTQRGDMAPTIRRLESREGLDAEEASEISETPDDRPLPRTLRYLEGLSYVQAVLWIGARLASGLAHAHDRSILHLDLKPANVLLTRDGQPMLLDFNLSLDLKAAERTKGIGGTVIYMSPEQSEAYRGASATVDARSDIYSLGIILHELLTGRRPFPDWAVSSPERMDARLERRGLPTQELRGRNKEVSPAVESIIRHCLEADPARRYQGASELQEDLERQLADLPLKHAPEPSCLERCSKWRRRHPAATRLSTIVAASILAIAGLGALTWQAVSDARRSRARLNSLAFHENFKVCQLLLNTVHLGSQDHLRRGIELADQAVNPFLKPGHSGRETQPLLPELTGDEEIAFRAELAELIMLQVRARVALTDSSPPLEGRRWVLEWGLEKLGLAGRIDPTPPAAYFHDRAHLYSLLGREKEAAEDRRRFESTPLRDARDHYLAGTAFLSLRRPDRAEHFLSRAVELAPGQFWTWFALGLCHSDQGRHADAAADFACSSITAKNLAWPYLNRGLCLARCGRLTEAVSTYGRALEIDPDFVEALVDRGLAFLDLGHPQAALDDLESAFARHSPPPELRAAHAEALSRLKRKADAEAEFAELLRSHPSNAQLLVARGFSRLGEDDDAAGADFGRALELDPKTARAYLGRALLLRRGDPRAALVDLEKALQLDPQLGDALQLRALTRARLNDPRAEADADALIAIPTPPRLYNAACTLSLLSRQEGGDGYKTRALNLLKRALDVGVDRDYVLADPDLEPIRKHPRFRAIIGTPRPRRARR